MTKDEGFGAKIDLKQFFEASVGALEVEMESAKAGDRVTRRNSPLVRRNPLAGSTKNRAVADAARALTALWRMQTSKKAI